MPRTKNHVSIQLCAVDGMTLKIFRVTRSSRRLTDSSTQIDQAPDFDFTSPHVAKFNVSQLIFKSKNAQKSSERFSEVEKEARAIARNARREYHRQAFAIARLKQALACLDTSVDPARLAIHIKNRISVEQSLDRALDWLNRFAMELHERDKVGYQ